MTLISFQCSEGSVDPGKVWKERIYWRKLFPDILLRLLSILYSILCQQSSACISMHTAYLTLFDVSHQTCLSQHFGRRAKTTSSTLRGYSCCPVKTSPSNTSSRRMLVVFLLHYYLIFISVPYFWLQVSFFNPTDVVEGSQGCHLHEGPECSFPTREDQSCAWTADLIYAGGTNEESVCLSWERAGELVCCCRETWQPNQSSV